MAITKIRGFTQVYSGSLEGIQLSQSLATKHGDQGKRQGYLDTGMNIPFHGDLPTKQHAPVGGILLSSSLGPSGEASSSKLVLDPMWKPTFHGGVFTEDVYVSGSITAYQFIVSASQTVVNTTTEQHRIVLFQSGSTKFGDTEDDQHAFTGSLLVSGSITVQGEIYDGAGNFLGYGGDDGTGIPYGMSVVLSDGSTKLVENVEAGDTLKSYPLQGSLSLPNKVTYDSSWKDWSATTVQVEALSANTTTVSSTTTHTYHLSYLLLFLLF